MYITRIIDPRLQSHRLNLGPGFGLGLGFGLVLGINRNIRPSNQRFTRVFGSLTSSILLFSAATKYKEINYSWYFKLTVCGLISSNITIKYLLNQRSFKFTHDYMFNLVLAGKLTHSLNHLCDFGHFRP